MANSSDEDGLDEAEFVTTLRRRSAKQLGEVSQLLSQSSPVASKKNPEEVELSPRGNSNTSNNQLLHHKDTTTRRRSDKHGTPPRHGRPPHTLTTVPSTSPSTTTATTTAPSSSSTTTPPSHHPHPPHQHQHQHNRRTTRRFRRRRLRTNRKYKFLPGERVLVENVECDLIYGRGSYCRPARVAVTDYAVVCGSVNATQPIPSQFAVVPLLSIERLTRADRKSNKGSSGNNGGNNGTTKKGDDMVREGER